MVVALPITRFAILVMAKMEPLVVPILLGLIRSLVLLAVLFALLLLLLVFSLRIGMHGKTAGTQCSRDGHDDESLKLHTFSLDKPPQSRRPLVR